MPHYLDKETCKPGMLVCPVGKPRRVGKVTKVFGDDDHYWFLEVQWPGDPTIRGYSCHDLRDFNSLYAEMSQRLTEVTQAMRSAEQL